jgi:hypothetical protein
MTVTLNELYIIIFDFSNVETKYVLRQVSQFFRHVFDTQRCIPPHPNLKLRFKNIWKPLDIIPIDHVTSYIILDWSQNDYWFEFWKEEYGMRIYKSVVRKEINYTYNDGKTITYYRQKENEKKKTIVEKIELPFVGERDVSTQQHDIWLAILLTISGTIGFCVKFCNFINS